MAKTQDFSLDFPGTAIDTQIFEVAGDPVVKNHEAIMDDGDGLTVINNYDLTDSFIFQKVGLEEGIIFIFSLDLDDNNKVGFVKNGDLLTFRATSNNKVTEVSIPYNAVNHLWWRLRESQGTVYFDTSADGKNWITRYNMPDPFNLTNLSIHYRTVSNLINVGWGYGPWGITPWGGGA